MHPLVQEIANAKSVLLSTHKQPDGDGLGSQVALYWALKKLGKQVRIVNVDEIPKKYNFLDTHSIIERFDKLKSPLGQYDMALIFDTNDPDLLLGLWSELQSHCKRVVFVDHHPALDRHPLNPKEHIIDIEASSTGQLVFDIVKALEIPIDTQIAMPLYTSIVFDTNYFRFIRGSSTPHLIVAELLRYNIEPQKVHRHLFGNHTVEKVKFLGLTLNKVEYELGGKLACVRVKKADLEAMGLEMDETRDIIDLVMNIESIEAAALFREDDANEFKLSFRTKGAFSVNQLAQSLGGGGHAFASGAYVKTTYKDIKDKVLKGFEKLFSEIEKKNRG